MLDDDKKERMMKAEELSSMFSVPMRTILRLAKEGKVPAIKIGGRWRFDRDVIERWMKDVSSCRGRGKILVVDDSPDDRQTLRRALEKMEIEIQEAASVKEAIDCLEKVKFDAVMLDLVFGHNLEGIDVLQWLGRRKMAIPVVIVTGFAETDFLKDALVYGTFVVLSKPFLREQLDEAVAMVMRWRDFK
ncbi:MAG: response regulator [Pseudomonadota bacterium]